MKPASNALKNLLATRQVLWADLYLFTLIGGGTLAYCTGDGGDITYNANTYLCGLTQGGPFFDTTSNKAKSHWVNQIQVDTMLFDVIPGNATVQGISFLQAVKNGYFDGAEVTRYALPMSTYGDTSAGAVLMFVGRVAEVDASRTLATFTVNSHLELLNQNMPRNLYQAACRHTLFDTGCALSAGDFAVTGTALTGSTANTINATLTQASHYFDQGKIVFTSGTNNGIARSVKTYLKGSPGTIALLSPFPNAPSNGDTFTVYPGCNKTQSVCTNTFNNLRNFGGEPYIPQIETAI